MSINQRQRLSALFVSFSVVIIGGASLLENMSFDYYTVVGTLKKILPASVVLGGLGWVMGMILDKPPKKKVTAYNKLMLKELIENSDNNMITHEANINISDDIQENQTIQEKENI